MSLEISNEILKKIQKVNDHWDDLMPIVTAEEVGTLLEAISKNERHRKSYPASNANGVCTHRKNFVKESVDVIISILALTYRYNVSPEQIEKKIVEKLEKI